jgi:hypothetical protein
MQPRVAAKRLPWEGERMHFSNAIWPAMKAIGRTRCAYTICPYILSSPEFHSQQFGAIRLSRMTSLFGEESMIAEVFGGKLS